MQFKKGETSMADALKTRDMMRHVEDFLIEEPIDREGTEKMESLRSHQSELTMNKISQKSIPDVDFGSIVQTPLQSPPGIKQIADTFTLAAPVSGQGMFDQSLITPDLNVTPEMNIDT